MCYTEGMKHTHCRHCDEKLSRLGDINYELFFWCNEECKDTQEKEQLVRRQESMKTHSPAVRRGEPDIWPELYKVMMYQREQGIDSNVEQPDGTVTKTGRKCGKCHGTGHNARTCKA